MGQVVDTLSAEIHSSSLNTLLATNKVFNRAASDRVYNSIATANSGFYIDGIYADSKIKQSGFASADVDVGGVLMGLDYKLNDRATLGLSLNQALSKAKFNKYAGDNEIKSLGAFVYGGYEFDDFYTAVRAGYTRAQNEVNRKIIDKSSKVNYNASLYSLYTEIGKKFNFDEANFYLANEINHIKRNGFSEKTEFGITSKGKDYTTNAFLVGARASINSGNFSFLANINHAYTPNPKDFSFVANFTDDNTPINIKGISEPKHHLSRAWAWL